MTLKQRLMDKIDIPDNPDDCWEWTGSKIRFGYGQIYNGEDGPMAAHRAMWQVAISALPSDRCVLHKCDNPGCVNPSHLFLGTYADNHDDMVSKGRRPVGESRTGSKLKNTEAENIKRDSRSQSIIAKEYGVSQSLVSLIKSGFRRGVSK